jgi:hypothetical protein
MLRGMCRYQRAGIPDRPTSFLADVVQQEKTERGSDSQTNWEGTRQAERLAARVPWLRSIVLALAVWSVWLTSAAASVIVLQAQQVTDASGTPLRESEIILRVPVLPAGITEEDFAFEVLVKNPADGVELFVLLDILAVVPKANRVLSVFVDGPVSTGSLLWISPDVSGMAGGKLIELNTPARFLSPSEAALWGKPTRTFPVPTPRTKFLSPSEAALWGKAYEPTNIDLFPANVYGGMPSQGIPQSTDPAVVREDLRQHFAAYIQTGRLHPALADLLLRWFDDVEKRQGFIDPTTGVFEPQLMAMVLATGGTPGQGSISAIIGGKNDTGRPARVVYYGELPPGSLAGASVQPDPIDGQDRWIITIHPLLRNEPFLTVSALIAHEAMHQDNIQGQDEEIAGKSAEINTWKQHLLVSPELASINTPLSRFLNLQTLMHENSGQSFPNGGIFEAPLAQGTQDVIPNSDFLTHTSFEDFLRNNVYVGVADVDTPGNRYLNAFLRQGTRGRWQPTQGFNDNTVARLDNLRFFTPAENFRILEILELQPVIKSLGPSAQDGVEEGQAQQAPPQKIIPWW